MRDNYLSVSQRKVTLLKASQYDLCVLGPISWKWKVCRPGQKTSRVITFQFIRETTARVPNLDTFLTRFYENERYKVFFRGWARQVLFSFTVTGGPPRRYRECTVVWSMSFLPNLVKVKGIWSQRLTRLRGIGTFLVAGCYWRTLTLLCTVSSVVFAPYKLRIPGQFSKIFNKYLDSCWSWLLICTGLNNKIGCILTNNFDSWRGSRRKYYLRYGIVRYVLIQHLPRSSWGLITRSRFSWQAVIAKTHFVVIPNVDFCQTKFWFLVDLVLGLLCWGAACIWRTR